MVHRLACAASKPALDMRGRSIWWVVAAAVVVVVVVVVAAVVGDWCVVVVALLVICFDLTILQREHALSFVCSLAAAPQVAHIGTAFAISRARKRWRPKFNFKKSFLFSLQRISRSSQNK